MRVNFGPRVSVFFAVLLLFVAPVGARVDAVVGGQPVTIDPATLAVVVGADEGEQVIVSGAQDGLGQAQQLQQSQQSAQWRLPEPGLTVHADWSGSGLTMRFVSDKPGEVTFPVIPGSKQAKAYILPKFEGIYAPTSDDQWMQYLIDYGAMDTTADLSMPFVGVDYGGQTAAYIFGNIFDNRVRFNKADSGVSATVTHTFKPNWKTWEYTVVIELGDASPIAPAKAYRQYLAERGEFVSMRQKIKANPKAKRLLGAAHAYLWDHGVFSYLDATDWKAFAKKLSQDGRGGADTPGKRLWDSLDQEGRGAVDEIINEPWPSKYLKSVLAGKVSAYLVSQLNEQGGATSRGTVFGSFCDYFAGMVLPYEQWGGGISLKLLEQLQAEGLDRMVLCLGDLNSAQYKPQVAARADELGYLFGPYDSYHSIHPPKGHPNYDANNTWETAQFPPMLYETGGVVKADGMISKGFKKVGYHLSPLAARPFVEQRVNDYMSTTPHSAVFVDCDAFGQFFDDYHRDHTATQRDDMLERLDRLRWLSDQHGLVVGSEGGSAYAAPAIHFAHGMFSPVIGWGDRDLKDKASPYYRGAYYPPTGPATFIKQVPLKPSYKKFFYDPRYRLPLYQVVFHDSVIATHHWGNASLKFKDQVQTVALLEQLYNVPPLYHLNLAELAKHKEHIKSHHAFFSPLHRELALQPLTGFDWLTEGRLVQQTTFGDGTRIVANFGETPADMDGVSLPGLSAVALRPGHEPVFYNPLPANE